MSEVSIQVNKQSLQQFFITGKINKFVIPEYQREYAWEEEQVCQLFDDIWDFTQNKVIDKDYQRNTYFLGCIVAYKNEQNEMEIIDGQQRLTTLFLLLCAIYKKLDNSTEDKYVNNFKSKIAPLLWEEDNLSGEIDKSKVLISSRVIVDDKNEIFHKILQSGEAIPHAYDKYSQNYLILQNKIDELTQSEHMNFYYFISALIDQVIFMPIISSNQDTAMTIFMTLNNRGLQLSDADIFKAKIYSHLPIEARSRFIDSWQQLTDEAKTVDLDIQTLFTYHSFYCRAKEGDKNSSIIAVRKYYEENNSQRLYSSELMDELWQIMTFWKVVRRHEIIEEKWSRNKRIQQLFSILENYSNEIWKYSPISYYLIHKDDVNFENKYLIFLRKLVALLIETYLFKPGVNTVKTKIFNLNTYIGKTSTPNFEFVELSDDELSEKLIIPSYKIIRMILALLVYEKSPNVLLPPKWDVEHILPKKYDSTFFLPNSSDEINAMLEHIGNLLPLERKNNIQASNGFFSKKKELYQKSNIEYVRDFSQSILTNTWTLDDIKARDNSMLLDIIHILHDFINTSWNWNGMQSTSNSYQNPLQESTNRQNAYQQSTNQQNAYQQNAYQQNTNQQSTFFSQGASNNTFSNFATRQNNSYPLPQKNYHTKAPRTSFSVVFPDGTSICESTAAITLAKCIEIIGPTRVIPVGITINGEEIVSMLPSTKYPSADKQIRGGYYVRTMSSTPTKIAQLQQISDYLHLNLKIYRI